MRGALWIGACIALCGGAGRADGDNLLADPGFEGSSVGAGPQNGWYRNYGDARSKWLVSAERPREGERCLRIEAPSLPDRDRAASVEQAVAVAPGRSYALSVWVRGEPEGAEGLLAIVWMDAQRRWLTHAGSSFRYSGEWRRETIVATAPEGAALGVARVDLRSPGVAWVDDARMAVRSVARLHALTPSGPVTAGATFRAAFRALDADGTPFEGARVTCDVLGPGPAASRRSLVASEGAEVAVLVRAGVTGQTTRVIARCGQARAEIRATAARAGTPTGLSVEPSVHAAEPGSQVAVRVRLVGGFGEPAPVAGRAVALRLIGDGVLSSRRLVTDRLGEGRVFVRLSGRLFASARVEASSPGCSAGLCSPIVAAPALRKTMLRVGPNRYFVDGRGRPFLPLGGLYANRVHVVEDGSARGLVSEAFTDASDDQLRAWFAYLRANGVTALRAMLRNHTRLGTEPMDIVGRCNERLLRQWERFMALARPYGIRFLVTLHESWYATYGAYFDAGVLERCVLPHYTDAELRRLPAHRRRFLVERRMLKQMTDPMLDPDVRACQRDYLADLIPRLRGNPDVFAYEIENEQPNGFYRWTCEQIATVRRYDPRTPICVSHLGGGLLSADPLPWAAETPIDFYTYHVYPAGAGTAPDLDYGTAVLTTARYALLGKPAFAGESFGDEWYRATPEARRLGGRDTIWMQLTSGNIGCMLWDTIDEPIKEFRLARRVAQMAGLGSFAVARPRVVVGVPPPGADDTRFQSPAGQRLYRAMSASARALARRGVDFRFATGPTRQAARLRAGDTAGASRVPPDIAISDGWEAAILRSASGDRLLAYVRNVAAIVPIQEDRSQGWTRARAARPLRLTVRAPVTGRWATLVDLDTGEERRMPFRQGQPINVESTDHDYALVVR